MNSTINKAQWLLLTWLDNCEEPQSYESIRKNCLYLDKAYSLGFSDTAVWKIFDPLLRSGVVEYAGNNRYGLPEPKAIKRGDLYLYISLREMKETPYIGICTTSNPSEVQEMKIISFDAYSVLKTVPCIADIVDSFPESIADIDGADYYHWKAKQGLTKRFKDSFIHYFSIPEKVYLREVPGMTVNPDAFNIAFSYSRAINNEYVGHYNQATMTMVMKKVGLPIMIERILLVESMTLGFIPKKDNDEIVFEGISKFVFRELNRILCKSISYE